MDGVKETVRTVGSNIEDEDKISIDEILRKVRKLKAGKAAGADEIRVEFINNGGMGGIRWLSRILNLALISGKIPADWLNAIIALQSVSFCRRSGFVDG